ncbi:SET domain-containing protein [Obba rivulosa]|uniref:SET domain-containing protein n=1 Tax=Obba rivulosa TaxID=1052685 RepID=A0A8E2B132_9APHY|nr:SET domain-containing protein [Obba rivulosa]
MSSGMRRGFLLSTTHTGRGGPALGSRVTPKKIAEIKIPCHPENQPEEAPAKGETTDDMTHLVLTVVPPSSPLLPDPDMYSALISFKTQKEKLLAIPGFPTSFTTPSPPVYRVQRAGGRFQGLGMFATQEVHIGDLIVRERALLITTQYVPPGPDGRPNIHAFDVAVHQQMSAPRRAMYLALSNIFPELPQTLGILNTNSLYIGALPGYNGACGGVFNDISRINHSCRPNAVFWWDLQSFSGQIRALAPIRPGEQIFITYIDMWPTRTVRQATLLKKYRFRCACGACTLTGAYAQYSDLRRAFIAMQLGDDLDGSTTDADLLAWAGNPALPDTMLVNAAELWLNWLLGEREMEERLSRVVFSRLCKAYAALEDEEAVKKYARQAAAYETAWTGSDGGWLAVAAAPQETAWWGLRRKARESNPSS